MTSIIKRGAAGLLLSLLLCVACFAATGLAFADDTEATRAGSDGLSFAIDPAWETDDPIIFTVSDMTTFVAKSFYNPAVVDIQSLYNEIGDVPFIGAVDDFKLIGSWYAKGLVYQAYAQDYEGDIIVMLLGFSLDGAGYFVNLVMGDEGLSADAAAQFYKSIEFDKTQVPGYEPLVVNGSSFGGTGSTEPLLNSALVYDVTNGEDTFIYEDDYVGIAYYDLAEESGQLKARLLVQNKTDKNLQAFPDYTSVNACMVSAYSDVEVPAGEVAEAYVNFWNDEFAAYGIETPAILGFQLTFCDDEYNTVTTTPCFILSVDNTDSLRSFTPEGIELLGVESDDSHFSALLTNYDSEGMWGPTLDFYFENAAPFDAIICLEDCAINGKEVYLPSYFGVPMGFCSIESTYIDAEELNELGIEAVEEIAFRVVVYDFDFNEMYSTDLLEFDVE